MNLNIATRARRSLDPTKRAAILSGARAVFMREGFALGTMDGVAAEAGVGKQTIYRHFQSKEALLGALVEAMCMPETVDPPPSSLPAGERLRQLLLAFTLGVSSSDSINLYRAIVAEAGRMPELGAQFWRAGYLPLRAAIEQLLTDHDIATTPKMAQQLIHLALGDAYQELVLGTGSPGPDVFEDQVNAALVLLGLSNPSVPHPARG